MILISFVIYRIGSSCNRVTVRNDTDVGRACDTLALFLILSFVKITRVDLRNDTDVGRACDTLAPFLILSFVKITRVDGALDPSLSKERRKSRPRGNWIPKDVLHQHSPTDSEGPNRPSSHDPRFNPARGCTGGSQLYVHWAHHNIAS
ncbi:hypothetical protein QE152_g7750 [Popillia japonica]|uniref:Uncharacterized protein n=1 Tax=Popillia japonica TaxID=7064 RepID=A0AAW1ME93_POPJA